jgi:hypothetical protein
MKKIYAITTAALFQAGAFAQITCDPPFTVETFTYTGAQQLFFVPMNVTQLYIEANGGGGADGLGSAPGIGGLGAGFREPSMSPEEAPISSTWDRPGAAWSVDTTAAEVEGSPTAGAEVGRPMCASEGQRRLTES